MELSFGARCAARAGLAATFLALGAPLASTATGQAGATAGASTPPAETVGWTTLPTAPYRGKRDDIVFATVKVGFYGTGAGDLFKTEDGGAH